MTSGGEVVWRPSESRAAASQLRAFARGAAARCGQEFGSYAELHRWSIEEPDAFWSELWEFCEVRAQTRGERVLLNPDRMPGARWFPDARLNFAENLLRRRDDTPALVFCGEQGVRRELSHAELWRRVETLASAFRAAGLAPGDRVAGLLPNLPESVIAMLACASLGAVWSSCSPDFGARGVLDRFGQIEPRILLCAEAYSYNGKIVDCLDGLPEILSGLPSLAHTLVVPHIAPRAELRLPPGCVFLEDFESEAPDEPLRFAALPFDHPLYILFSSGTTGQPKCIVHGAGGTLLQHLKEQRLHVDLRPGDRFFFFTTCGWMMWNWLASGLASEATLVLYDGSPLLEGGRALFQMAEREGVEVFGVSAVFLDAVAKAGLRPGREFDLSGVRTLLSTGSPLLPEGYDFVYRDIASDLHLASISGGTDLIGCFVLGNPTEPVRRGEIQCKALGMAVEIWGPEGERLVGSEGELVCTRPFPSMPVGFWNDPDDERYRAAYFEAFPGVWHHGDWVVETPEGGFVITGRSDSVLNPGGVRIGTAELYRPVESLPEVLERVAIGQRWEGDVRIVLFVRLRAGEQLDAELEARIRTRVRTRASPRHVPARILEVPDIPRTRSGKISEIAVREVVHGRPIRNQEALANPEALDFFRNRPELDA